MAFSVKKAARTLQVIAPGLQELRYAVHRKVLHLFRRSWRRDAEAIRHFGVEKPMIIDVGANRGFSISAFLMLKPSANIVAFEPLSSSAEILRIRYKEVENITIHSCALGNEDAQLVIYVPVYRGFRFDPLASLNYAEAANWVNSDRFYFFDAKKLKIEEESVSVRRLDAFNLKPDIIKIYAQGYEPSVIQGGEITIRKYEPAIMAPAHLSSVNKYLRYLGYTRYGFYNSKFYDETEGSAFSSYLKWYLKPKHLELFRCPISRAT